MIQESFRRHWLGVALLALACGLAGGAYAGYRSAMATAWVHAVEYDRHLGAEAFRQYKTGNLEEARRALAAHLGYLEAMQPSSDGWRPGEHPWLNSKTLAFDRMLASGRLALIDERASGSPSTDSLWVAAAKYAQEAGQPDVSRAAIERIIQRLDANPEPGGANPPRKD
jgi:hypothetical protein